MRANSLSVLGAFAVGCLSSAAVFGFWRAESAADAKSRVRDSEPAARRVARAVEPPPATPAYTPRNPADTTEPRAEPRVEAPPLASAPEPANGSAPAAYGSAVSDVLMDLEAAYRQRLIAAARAEAEAAPEPPGPPPPVSAPATPPAPVAAARAVAPAVLPPPAPPPSEPPPNSPPEIAPPSAPPPAVMAQNDARAPDVHIGDINQNTYITNVRQGDVYVIQQQLAMMNYMQMLGNSAYPGSLHAPRGGAQHVPQSAPFKSTLTNLDNPWGFQFKNPYLLP